MREIDEFILSRYPGQPVYGIEVAGFVDSGGAFALLYVGADLAGCGALRPLPDGTMEVKRMYVRDAFRGQGIARQLLSRLELMARDSGIRIMRIETGDRQPEALGLYRSVGYADIPRYGPYVENPQSICLAKPLLSRDEQEFLDSFEHCTLPATEWTHLAHVRVAWLCLTQGAAEDALARISSGILRYNSEVLNRRHKYHETVTVAFTRIVASRVSAMQTWEEFCGGIEDILDPEMPILLRYYSAALLYSDRAREFFVEPDIEKLPPLRGVPDRHLAERR